ncbi:hypothetical protein CWE12_13020 [Aliidiomarina sedimenti]|uniref:DUF3278 domain-containing protein n=1 Tax=Aliidiomarina sedimenti TaxID=1933879 RepID=A0ABY0BVC5_9GAMM|nr:hypothetical protein [Aliidiomarina sedimenti]RUO28135.1 hypothetical protein CWE12_13020 [Aliidiomarina sedimenti]
MKHSARNPYDAWTPDAQVEALKRSAYAVFLFTFGIAVLNSVYWFEFSALVSILLLMLGIGCQIVAFIWYVPSGSLLDVGLFKSSRIDDEYCRQVLFSAYQLTAWLLLTTLAVGWLFLDKLLSWVGVHTADPNYVAGGYLVIGVLTWGSIILFQLRDTAEEESSEEGCGKQEKTND